jgi:hypothetical protein
VTHARIRKIDPDRTLAERFLKQAKGFLSDGASAVVSRESRQVLLHNAAIAACDGVLAAEGFEVEGSEGGHGLRLEKAEKLLGGDLEDLFERLDSVRMTRADASYRAGLVADHDVDEAAVAVAELVRHVEDAIGG